MNAPAPAPAATGVQPVDRSRQIIAGLAEGFASFDADWRFVDCNAAAEALLDQGRQDLIGRRFCDVSGLAWESPFAALVRRVAETQAPQDAELTFAGGGGPRLVAVHAFPLEDGVAAVWRDITAARAAERRLALSEARYHEIAQGLPTAAWLSRENGELEFINQAMVEALGRPRRELLRDGWLDAIDPADRPHLLAVRARSRAAHSSFHYEGRFRRPDGTLRIIELYGRPRFDALGAFRGHVGIATDVTEARDAEQRRQLLINELNHRVKNTLAMVQALVRHTLRDHAVPREVEHEVTERLIALSAAHDVLSREDWRDAEVTEVIGELLQPYESAGRFSMSGPKARIPPRAAIGLAMGLQELATNAAKYGAFSAPGGRVDLRWRRRGPEIELEWRERGGPPLTQAPKLSGFGSLLLGRVMAGQLGHPAEITYTPEGLTCRLRAPLAAAAPVAAAG